MQGMGRQADYAQVLAAFALPLALVAVAGWFAWNETWNHAEGELMRTADGAAELADRVFSSATLAARLTNTVLTGVSDTELQRDEARYHQKIAGIMAELPGSNMISVSDRDGALRLMSGRFPAARISVADREWVKALQADGAPKIYVGALALGRAEGLPFFSINIPRSGTGNDVAAGAYDGIITVSLDPDEIAQQLRNTTQEDADVIALVRDDGEILASTRGNRTGVPRVPATSPLLASIAEGTDRGIYEGQSLGLRDGLPLGRGIKIAFKRVGSLPVYTTVSRTPTAIVAPWLRTMAALLAVGLPASLALGALSLTSLRRRKALAKSEAELAAAFESAATGTALIDSRTNRILKVNRRLCEITGRDASELAGFTLDLFLEAREDRGDQLPSGEVDATAGLSRVQRPDGSIRWIELGTAPVASARIADPSLVIATFHDVTEQRQARERQILLAREVDHRAKNVLAIVQAVVRMERDFAASGYVTRVEGRIRALGRAHELLAEDSWQGVGLKSLVDEELAAYRTGAPLSVDGPGIVISSNAVQPLAMILHELATNAAKHGAIARPEGKLCISWNVDIRTGGLELRWREELGPDAGSTTAPGGTGLTIVKGSVDQLGGEVAFDWRDTGLVCRILLPDTAFAEDGRVHADNTDAPPAGTPDGIPGRRALLAEDEFLVAMEMQDLLESNGFEVIGPAHSLKEARQLAELEAGRIDVAILDVNLRGDLSIDLARELGRAGIGVLLVTGYSEIPGKVQGDSWTELRKPVSETDLVRALRTIARTGRSDKDPALAL